MRAIIYTGSNEDPENYISIVNSLRKVAHSKKWQVIATINEAASEDKQYDPGYHPVTDYLYSNGINDAIVMIMELKHAASNIAEIINFINILHEENNSLYIDEYNVISWENGKRSPTLEFLLEKLSMVAQIENQHRKRLQRKGIARAKSQGKYLGRRKGATANIDKLRKKYFRIIELLDDGFTLGEISLITKFSINTIRKVRNLFHKNEPKKNMQ